MTHRLRNVALAAGIALFLVFSLERLFEYRFAAGDVYPPGSSLRADPVGAKAFFQALDLLPDLRVQRGLEHLSRREQRPGTTVFVLGVPAGRLASPSGDRDDDRALEQWARAGARVVVAFAHESADALTNHWGVATRAFRAGAAGTNASDHFDVRLGFGLAPTNASATAVARRAAAVPALPDSLPWADGWTLSSLAADWHVVYARDNAPVVAERTLGSGSVVLVASDFLLCNGSQRAARQPGFLAWLVGPNHDVLFDETHLGIRLEPGIASLVRKYRLGGAVAGLLALALLYVWRQSARFNPPPGDPAATAVAGRASAGGLANVLRRAVPAANLAEVCFAEWRRSLGRHPNLPESRLADAQEAANLERAKPPRERDPADFHRRLARLLRHR